MVALALMCVVMLGQGKAVRVNSWLSAVIEFDRMWRLLVDQECLGLLRSAQLHRRKVVFVDRRLSHQGHLLLNECQLTKHYIHALTSTRLYGRLIATS